MAKKEKDSAKAACAPLAQRQSNGVPKHLYLIDGSGFIFRAYFAIPPQSTSKGLPTNAAFGFTNMLVKLMRDSDADGAAVIFDKARKSFRNEIYPDYKAQRPDAPEDLVPQFEMVREATRAFNLPCIEMDNYEADDLIASYVRLAREAGSEVTIVSSDKDLMQLVGPGVVMADPMKSRTIGPEEVAEKFGVPPEKVVDVQALAGDSVDNVPGVPGIGVKTAAQLIQEYGDLDSLLARAEEIKQPKRRENLIAHAEQARISRDLVRLKDDVPLPRDLEELHLKPFEPDVLRGFFETYEFRSLLARFAANLGEPAAEGGGAKEPESEGYELIQEEGRLEAWCRQALDQGYLAVDTETTGLNALQADLVGVSLALAPKKACYIPLAHVAESADGEGGLALEGKPEAPKQIALEKAIAILKPLFEDPSVLKIGQNIKYDMLVLARYGIELAPFDDTMLLSYVLDGGLHGHGMDELAALHLDHKTISFKDVAGSGKSQVTFDRVPLGKALDYAAEDADITLRLHGLLKPRLLAERRSTVYETLERPLVTVLAAIERTGIKVDRAALSRLSNDFASRIAALEGEIHDLAGRKFTIGSPKQLGEVLFDDMGLTGGKKGKSGAYATGADILEGLAAQGHELPEKVLTWRQLSKLKSTYTDALQEAINPETGRVHTSFGQTIATTGRLSSSDPNLQNIPVRTEEGRKIRHAFVAAEGCKLLSVDYSQIELRLTADIAGVSALREAFLDGQDIHATTASQVFGIPIEGMDPMIRRKAKAINFGIIYGISAFGLAQNLAIPQSEAKDYIEAYFERYPEIRDYMERTKAQARDKGYVETLFGRRIHTPAIKDKNPARRNFAERAAINAPIQGTAADIIKRAMVRMLPALEQEGLKSRMILQVHDELLFEVPLAELDACEALAKRIMEGAAAPAVNLSLPLIADAGAGDNWAEAH